MSSRDQLLQATKVAHERATATRARNLRELDRPPGPGDLMVLEMGGAAMEWVILEEGVRASDGGHRLFAVPGDGGSLVGSADLRLPASSPCAPLTVRCRLARWLDAAFLARGARVGTLLGDEVERIRRRCSEIEAGTFKGSVLGLEVDEESEYQDWIEEVVTALAALPAAPEQPVGTYAPPVSKSGAPFLLAASILLAILAGLAGTLLWQQLLQEERQESVMVNPVLAVLDPPGSLRGRVETLRLPSGTSHVVLLLPLGEATPAPEYRIEFLAQASGKTVWSGGGFLPKEPGEVRVGLPTSLLVPGLYRLRLLALEGERVRPVAEHALRIVGQ